jgi:hypothetical protein
MGFNVHAEVVVDGKERERLERVCSYLGRPPIAQERLERLADATDERIATPRPAVQWSDRARVGPMNPFATRNTLRGPLRAAA